MDRIAHVYFYNQYAGQIKETSNGFNFIYDTNYMLTGTPIGFNFPFTQAKYYSPVLFPIFENLASEGWLLNLQANMQHIDEKDRFGLLINNGKDLTGAITILKELI